MKFKDYAATLYWIPITLLEVTLILTGWVIIPIMAALGRYSMQESQYYPGLKLLWDDKFMFPWQNYEDGIAAGTSYYKASNTFLQIIYWSANRNPAEGTRWVSALTCRWKPEDVTYSGSFGDQLKKYDSNEEQWFFTRCGIYSGYYLVKRMPVLGLRRLFIGWALYPTDTLKGPYGYRLWGAGFKLQFKKLE